MDELLGTTVPCRNGVEPDAATTPVAADTDTHRFTAAFRNIRRGYAVRKIEAATVMGLMTMDELEILLILAARAEPIRMGELSNLAQSNPANTARTVKLLGAKHFVQRSPSALDGRGAVVEVTPAGRATAEQLQKRRTQLLGEVMRALPGGNGEYLVEALEQLSIALESAAAAIEEEPRS